LELEDVRAFQVHLISTGISWMALNQIVCALRFFYGALQRIAHICRKQNRCARPAGMLIIVISYKRYRSPPEIIQHAFWLYLRFTQLSRRRRLVSGTGHLGLLRAQTACGCF
jgi:hypothetical protein